MSRRWPGVPPEIEGPTARPKRYWRRAGFAIAACFAALALYHFTTEKESHGHTKPPRAEAR
jgi:hypothetical protein